MSQYRKRSRKQKKINIKDIRWSKSFPKNTPDQLKNKFVDVLELIDSIQGSESAPTFKLSTGTIDPNSLNSSHHKKHGAIYVSIKNMTSLFLLKKFGIDDKAKPHKQLQMFLDSQDFVEKFIGPHMENDSWISVEFMNIQRKEYNKLLPQFEKAAVIPHGAIYAQIGKLPSDPYSMLDNLCELSMFEGYVVFDRENGKRLKLKREYFISKENHDKQRGEHTLAPSIENGDYTNEALKMVDDGLGYANIPLIMSTDPDHHDELTIAKYNVDDVEISLVARSFKETIDHQTKFGVFDGEKMLNFFKTDGKGDTYKYTHDLQDDILEHDLEFQLKFDGETALVYKDNNGCSHLMIKYQVDVYEIVDDNDNKSYRFGWI